MECDNLQVMEYGYSILTYAIKYDQTWIESVEILKNLIRLANMNRRKTTVPACTNYFPDESVHQVMEYLDDKDLRVMALVSKTWNSLSCRTELWENLLRTRFSVSSSALKSKTVHNGLFLHPKLVYKEMLLSFHNLLRRMDGEKMRSVPVIPSYLVQHSIAA